MWKVYCIKYLFFIVIFSGCSTPEKHISYFSFQKEFCRSRVVALSSWVDKDFIYKDDFLWLKKNCGHIFSKLIDALPLVGISLESSFKLIDNYNAISSTHSGVFWNESLYVLYDYYPDSGKMSLSNSRLKFDEYPVNADNHLSVVRYFDSNSFSTLLIENIPTSSRTNLGSSVYTEYDSEEKSFYSFAFVPR